MKRLPLLVVASLAATGCVDFDKDLTQYCDFNPSRCTGDSGTGGTGGSATGGGSAGGSGGSATGGGLATGGGSGGDAGTDAGIPPCATALCNVQSYVTKYTFFVMSSTAKDNVWFAGDEVDHWNGSALSSEQISQYRLFAISATSPTDVWAGGNEDLPFHYDGSAWKSKPWDGGTSIGSMYARGPTEAYLVSDYSLYAWDGAAWSKSFSVDPNDANGQYLSYVNGNPSVGPFWALRDTDVWRFDASDAGAAEVAPAGNSNTLNGLHVTPAGGVWAVGDFGTVLHRDPDTHTWTAIPIDVAPHNSTGLYAVWAPNDTEAWVAGDLGALLRYRTDAGWDKYDTVPVVPGGGSSNIDIVWFDMAVNGDEMWVAGGEQQIDIGQFDAGVIAHLKLGQQ